MRALDPEQCAQDNTVRDVFVQIVVQSGAEAPAQIQPHVAADRPQLESLGVVEREPNGIVVAQCSDGALQQREPSGQSILAYRSILGRPLFPLRQLLLVPLYTRLLDTVDGSLLAHAKKKGESLFWRFGGEWGHTTHDLGAQVYHWTGLPAGLPLVQPRTFPPPWEEGLESGSL